MKANLICNVPSSVYYIPNFITEIQEQVIIEKVNSVPKPKWTQLSNRRLQNWGGIPHPKGMISEPIPVWLQEIMNQVASLNVFGEEFKPNHVLINEYLPGQGIMAHFDGPLFYPTIATISCGSHTVLNFNKPSINNMQSSETAGKEAISLLLEPRSLLILQDSMYHEYQHSIYEINQDVLAENILNLSHTGKSYSVGDILDRSTRVSLTIRHVPKTTKLKINLGR